MQTKTGAVLLVAGTCIGSGMIALPLVLAKLGLILSVLLMVFIWYIMYYTSLINLELNLQAGEGLPLGALGRRFAGKGAGLMGEASLKLLSYALLSVFIYGASSVLQEMLSQQLHREFSFNAMATACAALSCALLLLPIKLIDYINRILFFGLLGVVLVLIGGLSLSMDWSHLPLFAQQPFDLSIWAALIPVVFTSFGFQVIFHTLTNYCKKNAPLLKQAFLWGSLIPALVYILWTCSVLSLLYHQNPSFYEKMVSGDVEVGSFIGSLSQAAKWEAVQQLIWWISLLAIFTSILGVGVGLCDALKERVASLAPFLTILPAYLVAIFIPNAFLAALGFAGLTLAVIAILLPTYLLWKIRGKEWHYPELKANWLITLSFFVGVSVAICELLNMALA